MVFFFVFLSSEHDLRMILSKMMINPWICGQTHADALCFLVAGMVATIGMIVPDLFGRFGGYLSPSMDLTLGGG